eukprot:4337402-Prymnesium_polylepis.2
MGVQAKWRSPQRARPGRRIRVAERVARRGASSKAPRRRGDAGHRARVAVLVMGKELGARALAQR